jgi:transposase-like protein
VTDKRRKKDEMLRSNKKSIEEREKGKEALGLRVKEPQTLPYRRLLFAKNTLIVAQIGQTVKEYINNFAMLLLGVVFYCPICGEPMFIHAWYDRSAYENEETFLLHIARYRCERCNKTHAILPDFLAPYRRHTIAAVENVIIEVLEEEKTIEATTGPQSIETTGRWVRRFRQHADHIAGALESFLYRFTGEIPEIISVGPRSPLTRIKEVISKVGGISSGGIFSLGNILLSKDAAGIWL